MRICFSAAVVAGGQFISVVTTVGASLSLFCSLDIVNLGARVYRPPVVHYYTDSLQNM